MTRVAPLEVVGTTSDDRRVGRPQSRTRAAARWTAAFDILLIIGGLIILHISVSGPIPSGGDGGNWLALAREALGEDVMAADVVYEPVFIEVLGWLLSVLGPVNGLLASALLADALLVTAVYLMVSRAGRGPGLVSAAMVGVAGYRLEAYAWGAYPQMLAIGLGLLTVWAAVRFVSSGRWWWLAPVGAGAVAVLATHKLVGGLMLMAIPAAALHAVWVERFRRESWKWAGLVVLLVGAVGVFFVASWLGASAQGVEPTLNPLGLSQVEQLVFVFEEAPIPWVILTVVAFIGLGSRSWSWGAGPVISASFGWVASSIVAFAVLGEPRILIQAQVAMVPVAVLMIWRWWRDREQASGWRRAAPMALGFLAIATLGSVVLTGLHRYDLAADWYRVVGERELGALAGLRDIVEPGDVAIASSGPNGNPIGWWVQGYAGIPTMTSIDEAFLAFPDEREQAEVTSELFAASPEEAAGLMESHGARFLILDRRGAHAGWASRGQPELVHVSDGTLWILMVRDGPR